MSLNISPRKIASFENRWERRLRFHGQTALPSGGKSEEAQPENLEQFATIVTPATLLALGIES